MKYRIFKSPGMFSGEREARAELISTKHGGGVRAAGDGIISAIVDHLKKECNVETSDIILTPLTEDGYSKETSTRFLSAKAFVDIKSNRPLVFRFDIIETEV